jgi:hypothetical protein
MRRMITGIAAVSLRLNLALRPLPNGAAASPAVECRRQVANSGF